MTDMSQTHSTLTHDARAVANELIGLSMNSSNCLTPHQIIKLVYISHGWMLGLYGERLIRQPALAWLYGPVVRDVYRALRHFRSAEVTRRIDVAGESFGLRSQDIIKQVFRKYGVLSGTQLSHLTHAPGTPWFEVWHARGRGLEIPNSLIRRHYERLASEARVHSVPVRTPAGFHRADRCS